MDRAKSQTSEKLKLWAQGSDSTEKDCRCPPKIKVRILQAILGSDTRVCGDNQCIEGERLSEECMEIQSEYWQVT